MASHGLSHPATAAGFRPAAGRAGDERFVALAAEIGRRCGAHAEAHDRANTFIGQGFGHLRQAGYLRLAVPAELGGLGASMRQVCYAQAELAKHCGSTALAVNMHHYLVLATAFRWRHGAAAAEGTLRRVASEDIVLMTSGGSDGIWPTGRAVKEDGGYRVSARKVFCSQAPVADVLTSMVAYDDPAEGPTVLVVAVPTASDGFRVVETWDTLGMRGTASHDFELTDVAIGEQQVIARRPWGKVDPVLRGALVHFSPPTAAVYFGIAAAARDETVRVVGGRTTPEGQPLAQDPTVQRQIGLMDARLMVAWWALLGALDELGDEYTPDERAVDLVSIAKRQVATTAVETVDTAMEVVGGASYFKRSPLERLHRDVRAGKYHPLTTEKTLLHAGRRALDLGVDRSW